MRSPKKRSAHPKQKNHGCWKHKLDHELIGIYQLQTHLTLFYKMKACKKIKLLPEWVFKEAKIVILGNFAKGLARQTGSKWPILAVTFKGPESLELGRYSKISRNSHFGAFFRAQQNSEKQRKLSRIQKAKKHSLRERKRIQAFHQAIFGHFVNGYSKAK